MGSLEDFEQSSGGSLFGALTRLYQETPELLAIFGNPDGSVRVHPGQVPPGTPLPFVVLSLVTARSEYAPASDLEGGVTYLNVWYTTFQVSTYAVGYDSAQWWSRLAHRFIDRKVLVVDCYEVIPYVGTRLEVLDPKRSEDGREVWHFAYRYDVKIAEFMAE